MRKAAKTNEHVQAVVNILLLVTFGGLAGLCLLFALGDFAVEQREGLSAIQAGHLILSEIRWLGLSGFFVVVLQKAWNK